jgi:putative MFS transporter
MTAPSALDSIIDSAQMGPFHWRLFWLCGIGWGLDMFAFTATSILIREVSGKYGLVAGQDGLYSLIAYFGMFLGAEFWAHVCDTYGRRSAFVGTILVQCIFYVAIAGCGHFYLIFICMAGIGFGSGGGLVTRGSLLVEWLPVTTRGKLAGALGVFW